MIYGPERQLMFSATPAEESMVATAEAPQPTKPRTAAQRAASRSNGRKSKGPKTTQGKSVSCRNALKHGLTTSKLAPPADVRKLDRDFARIHAELIYEFQPVTFTEHRTVEELAWNLQRLDQAKQMIDAVSTPPEFANESLKDQYRMYRRAYRDKRLADDLLAALRSGETPDLTASRADYLAERVVALVNQVDQQLVEASEELAGLLSLEAQGKLSDNEKDELAELRELQEHHRLIHPCRRVLRDDARLAAAFRGEQGIGKTLRKSLIGLVANLRLHAGGRAAGFLPVVRRLERAADLHLMRMAIKPDQLMNLDDYRGRIAGAIRRQIANLRESCG